MPGTREVLIDVYPESAFRHLECDALVCIDVIDATTAMVTGAHQGRQVLPVTTPHEALALKPRLAPAPLLSFPQEAGAVTTGQPIGLAALAGLDENERALIVAGSPGVRLVLNASAAAAVYVACFRNMTGTAAALASVPGKVVLIAAGVEGESRCEDEMAAVRIARLLIARGFQPGDNSTSDLIARWADADLMLARYGKSVEDLRRSGRNEDVEFILNQIDDLAVACRYAQGEVIGLESAVAARPASTGLAVAAHRRAEVTL